MRAPPLYVSGFIQLIKAAREAGVLIERSPGPWGKHRAVLPSAAGRDVPRRARNLPAQKQGFVFVVSIGRGHGTQDVPSLIVRTDGGS